MGVDIYGLNPQQSGTRPEMPDNYQDLPKHEQIAYWNALHEWENLNPGYYFRNNWWHWRPIVVLITMLNDEHNIGIPEREIQHLSYNNGHGVSEPAHCQQLALLIKDKVEQWEKEGKSIINLNISGKWYFKTVGVKGEIETLPVNNNDITNQLNDKYPVGQLFTEDVQLDEIAYECSHATSIDNIKEFMLFLENCNGFKIH